MYQVNLLNSNRFQPKDFARCEPKLQDKVKKPCYCKPLDMIIEQGKDESITQIKQGLQNDPLSPSLARKHLLLDNILYYISHPDTEPTLRLYIPEHLKESVLSEYHKALGHMGIDKTYNAIS